MSEREQIYRITNSGKVIPVGELVRCKDCRHLFDAEHNDNCCDVLMGKVEWGVEITVDPDWYCADGKRKEGEQE